MVNIFMVENCSQIVHIEDHLMFYSIIQNCEKCPDTNAGQTLIAQFVSMALIAGARVIIACRDLKKGEEAADEIRRDTKDMEGAGQIVLVQLDLSSIASIRECAHKILSTEQRIDILVNNAGI